MTNGARLTTLTRLGFAARGLLYLVIAVLVIRTGRAEDPSGALAYLAEGGGRVLLMLMAAGLLAYGLWRLTDAAINIEGHEDGGKGLRERLGAAGSGVVHLALAWQAVRLIQGSGGGGGSGTGAGGAPGGELGLLIAGAVLLAVGAFQLVKAAKCSFCKHLDPSVAHTDWVKWTGRLGYSARGVVFMISGFFLLRAGLGSGGGNEGGMQQALAWLDNPWDVVVALGLFAFGLFSMVEARFRRIHEVPVDAIARGIGPGDARQ
jgi:hypothetical protein